MRIEEISECHWTNTRAAQALAARVQGILGGEDQSLPPMGTTRLVRRLFPGCTEKQMKNLCSLLGTCREDGMLDGYFTRGAKGMTGHPRVLWKATEPSASAVVNGRDARQRAEAESLALDLQDDETIELDAPV